MKETLPANQQSCKSDEKRTDQETIKKTEGNESITYSELLTSDDECPLSSMLNLPLSKGMTTNTTNLPSSTAALAPPQQQFIPIHPYPYPPKSNEALALPETLNFQSHELPIQNTCNSDVVDQTPPYFPSNRSFEMKEVPRFHEVDAKLDSARKLTSEILQNQNRNATGGSRITCPIKFGENSRKRQRTNDGAKTALQRKMEHLDKEKERRLRQTKCYDYLRSLVPCGSLKTDKANILEATVSYLTYIKETLGATMDVIDKNFLDEFERNRGSSE